MSEQRFFVDINAINQQAQAEEAAHKRAGFFSQREIPAGGEQVIRLLPPLKSQGGRYYLTEYSIWINKKNYISPKTFGLPCPILDTVKEAKKSGHATKAQLLGNDKIYNEAEQYIMPVVLFNPSSPGSLNYIPDPTPCIFTCSYMVIKDISSLVTHRIYQNGTPLGIFDFASGFNLIVSKTVNNKKTSYKVMAEPTPTPMELSIADDMPDIVDHLKKKIYSNFYLQAVIDNFLTGSPMPSDDDKYINKEPIVVASTQTAATPDRAPAPNGAIIGKVVQEESKAEPYIAPPTTSPVDTEANLPSNPIAVKSEEGKPLSMLELLAQQAENK